MPKSFKLVNAKVRIQWIDGNGRHRFANYDDPVLADSHIQRLKSIGIKQVDKLCR